MSKKVYVGMSGGVDSSLSAALLKEQGYSVTGVYMKNWSQDLPGFVCPWKEDYQDAKRVAVGLGIDFKLYDFEKDYRHKVVDYMLKEYKAGRTPNPDIMCNQEVKFKFRDDRCLITLRHSEVSPALASQAGWNKLREIIQERHPDAEVSEGCACLNSCGAGGCSFTIRRRTGFGDLMLITRLSFIPVEGGTVEVSMTANGNKFATEEFVFRNFLNCLRIEKSNPPKASLAE